MTNRPLRLTLAAAALAAIALPAPAASGSYFKFKELLASESVREFQDPGIQLYWSDTPTPAFAEVARPDTYTRSSISLSPFGGSARHCVDAFERALKATIEDAARRGYDAVTQLRVVVDGQPSSDIDGFNCKPGYKTTEVALMSTFAMSAEAARRMTQADTGQASAAARPPAEGAVYLPLVPILSSPEAVAILGRDLTLHWGPVDPPPYKERYGPDNYSEEADVRKLGNEGACRQAALETLSVIAKDARERKYDTIIRLRSALDGRYAPVVTDLECRLDKKTATVALRASLANAR